MDNDDKTLSGGESAQPSASDPLVEGAGKPFDSVVPVVSMGSSPSHKMREIAEKAVEALALRREPAIGAYNIVLAAMEEWGLVATGIAIKTIDDCVALIEQNQQLGQQLEEARGHAIKAWDENKALLAEWHKDLRRIESLETALAAEREKHSQDLEMLHRQRQAAERQRESVMEQLAAANRKIEEQMDFRQGQEERHKQELDAERQCSAMWKRQALDEREKVTAPEDQLDAAREKRELRKCS
jgi:hypothetical protein